MKQSKPNGKTAIEFKAGYLEEYFAQGLTTIFYTHLDYYKVIQFLLFNNYINISISIIDCPHCKAEFFINLKTKTFACSSCKQMYFSVNELLENI